MINKEEFIPDYIEDFHNDNVVYIIDLKWFDKIHCRRPYYECINFIEYYILNDDNEVIDSIKLPKEPFVDTLYKVDKETYDKIRSYMKEEENSISANENLIYLEPVETVASNTLPKTFVIDCDSIYLSQKSVDLEIQIPTQKVEQFDCIVINGITFRKDKSE